MRRWGLIVAGTAVFALVASQLLVPTLGERAVADRLTANGGSAEVELGAVPALRLLFGDGERLEVSARDLELDLDQPEPVLDRLDGFTRVAIAIESSVAGPFELDSFELSRDGDGPYRLVSEGRTTASALADYGLESVEIPGGSFAGAILDQLFGEADQSIPLELDMLLRSADGRIEVVSGEGSVAGFDTGPLAQLIAAAIVARL